jgi:hypothetical protein
VLNTETWLKISEFPLYEVSDMGRVRNAGTLHVMATYPINSGYLVSSFTRRGEKTVDKRLLHRLVAEAFVVKPDGADVVNHLDGDRRNNKAKNLEWTTQKGNMQHAAEVGLWSYNKPTAGLKLPSRSTTAKASKYIGICWVNSRQRWAARVVHDGKVYGQRRFVEEIEAAKYRDSVVRAHSLPLKLNFSETPNDYPAREYTQVSGNGDLLTGKAEAVDIV